MKGSSRLRPSSPVPDALVTLVLTVPLFLALQALIILMHEYAHSSAAWLLGYSATPATVVWGDLLTLRGWDEGVPYDQLFASGGNWAESVIGGIPLFLHAILAAAGLVLLQRPWMRHRRWLANALYWFLVMNLAELVAYILMRPFTPDGDTGRFNQGLHLSPWILFVVGGCLLIFALMLLFRKITPVLDEVIAQGNPITYWTMTAATAFVLFLWGSGLRFMLLYPDPQWLWGLIGVPLFFIWIGAEKFRDA